VREAQAAVAGGATGYLAQRAADGGVVTPEMITLAAEDGDAMAIALLQRSARVVGESIAALVNMFNPGVIVIGGAMAGAGEIYLAEVRQRVYELSLPLATRDLTIAPSVNDVREPLRGGIEMVREQLFDVTFPRWFSDGRPSVEGVLAAS
jgi:predicted NBD/HSP70 family sugar kinase